MAGPRARCLPRADPRPLGRRRRSQHPRARGTRARHVATDPRATRLRARRRDRSSPRPDDMLSRELREFAQCPDRYTLIASDAERWADERVCVIQGTVWRACRASACMRTTSIRSWPRCASGSRRRSARSGGSIPTRRRPTCASGCSTVGSRCRRTATGHCMPWPASNRRPRHPPGLPFGWSRRSRTGSPRSRSCGTPSRRRPSSASSNGRTFAWSSTQRRQPECLRRSSRRSTGVLRVSDDRSTPTAASS